MPTDITLSEGRREISPGWRLAIGFILSPLAMPVPLVVVFGVAWMAEVRSFGAGTFVERVRWTMDLAGTLVPFGYVVTFFVAVPLVARLLHRGMATRRRVIALGAWLGGAPFLLYFGYVAGFELWRAAGLPADAPVLGIWGTIDRLLRDGPVAVVWLTAGVACGTATAAVLTVIASKALDRI